jgi:hypothetical protein
MPPRWYGVPPAGPITMNEPVHMSPARDRAGEGSLRTRDGTEEAAAGAPVFIEEAFARDTKQTGPAHRRPWWQMAGAPYQGFIMGGCYVLFGAAFLALGVITGLGMWFVAAVTFVGPAAVQVLSAAVLYRRERRASQTGRDQQTPAP